jgi:hypothetical protein
VYLAQSLPLSKDPFSEHARHVETLAAQGITPPEAWSTVHQQFVAFLAMAAPMREPLVEAIVTPDSREDVLALRACSIAEATTAHIQAEVNRYVVDRGHTKLVDLYAPHAHENHKQIADQFDKAAQEFATAVKVADPETIGEQMFNAAAAERKAWTEAPLLATKLDTLMPALQSAAALAGVDTSKRESTLALVVDPAGKPRRHIWDAWNADGRCGHWSALLKAGAIIRAHNLQGFAPYRYADPDNGHNLKAVSA